MKRSLAFYWRSICANRRAVTKPTNCLKISTPTSLAEKKSTPIGSWRFSISIKLFRLNFRQCLTIWFADYSLTQYLFHFLTREALDIDPLGKEFVQDPSVFLGEHNGRTRLTISMTPVVSALMRLTDAELKRREDADPPEVFDYKKDLKSKGKVAELRSRIIPGYQMAIDARMAKTFSDLWSESA